MGYRHRRLSTPLYVAVATLAGVIVAYSAGIRFTLTPSMPIGVYRLVDGPYAKGTMVTFCPPARAAEFALERGYLHRGPCDGGTEPLGKYILAMPGDTLVVQAHGITLNGEAIPASAIHYRDRLGRELMHLPFGEHVVGPDSLFLFSGHHPRSFDSRYFGPVPRNVPEDEPLRVRFDATTSKKTGRKLEGASTYRNGAGTARQEWRTLWGLNFVVGEMRIRLSAWPEGFVSVPIGLRLYLKQKHAQALGRPYYTRSELARQLLDPLCRLVGRGRTVLSVQDGDYATKKFLQDLPENACVVGRLPIDSPLYARPQPKGPGQPGPPAKKGPRLGNAKELAAAARRQAWQAHPEEDGVEVLVIEGFWHTVMPGVWLRVVIVRRPQEQVTKQKKALEAFFTSLLRLDMKQILA